MRTQRPRFSFLVFIDNTGIALQYVKKKSPFGEGMIDLHLTVPLGLVSNCWSPVSGIAQSSPHSSPVVSYVETRSTILSWVEMWAKTSTAAGDGFWPLLGHREGKLVTWKTLISFLNHPWIFNSHPQNSFHGKSGHRANTIKNVNTVVFLFHCFLIAFALWEDSWCKEGPITTKPAGSKFRLINLFRDPIS